ncbi:MAG: DUF1295 domain-containing protein [Pseudomonadota bacterium]|nr:DUF1295 domain-containing protein [Pseudomonadota bacterium]
MFALLMFALMFMRINIGIWSELNWLILGSSFFLCLLVFYCFVYIFNFSYAFSCMLNGLLIIIFLPSTSSLLIGALVALYGLRLAAFSWQRMHSDSYAARLEQTKRNDEKMYTSIKLILWIQCGILYTFHTFSIYLLANDSKVINNLVFTAAGIIFLGIIVQHFADQQKQRAKAIEPNKHFTSGLFKRCRHPNYSGEILVQIGLILVGISAVSEGWENYLAVSVSPTYIIFLMISESIRADKQLQTQYKLNQGFQEYWNRSWSLLPKIFKY